MLPPTPKPGAPAEAGLDARPEPEQQLKEKKKESARDVAPHNLPLWRAGNCEGQHHRKKAIQLPLRISRSQSKKAKKRGVTERVSGRASYSPEKSTSYVCSQ